MDLFEFIKNVDNTAHIIYHFLARMRNHSPLRHEFIELPDLFYIVLMPLMNHMDANREYLRRGSRLYEVTSQK